MKIELTRSAAKEFAALPQDVQRRFGDAIERLRADPRRARPGVDVRKLRGGPDAWRLRVGAYRAVFTIEVDSIVFTRFAHRSTVYDV